MAAFSILRRAASLTIFALSLAILRNAAKEHMARAQAAPQARQTEGQTAAQLPQIQYVPPPSPPDRGTPHGRSGGGASRGECQAYKSLAALVPEHKGYVWGTSTSARPSFWFYVPAVGPSGLPLEFVLQDDNDRFIYRTAFSLQPGSADVLGLAVPDIAMPLETDRLYRWTLSVRCDPDQPTAMLYTRGSVLHVATAPDMQAQLAAAAPLERAAIYASYGHWYDALAELGHLRHIEPDNPVYAQSWAQLLQQANLNDPEVSAIPPHWAIVPTLE